MLEEVRKRFGRFMDIAYMEIDTRIDPTLEGMVGTCPIT